MCCGLSRNGDVNRRIRASLAAIGPGPVLAPSSLEVKPRAFVSAMGFVVASLVSVTPGFAGPHGKMYWTDAADLLATGLDAPFGIALDLSPSADWDFDGDRTADIGVYRQTTGEWFVLRSSDSSLSRLGGGRRRWATCRSRPTTTATAKRTSACIDQSLIHI